MLNGLTRKIFKKAKKMSQKYIVKQGDCISSIAFKYGLFPEVIWDHPDNAGLKKKREDPNALFPGDAVAIPNKAVKEEACETCQRHRFRRRGAAEKLRIQFLDGDGKPRKGVPYMLDMKTKRGRPIPVIKNKTDSDGFLDETIPPNAFEGEIILGKGEEMEWIPVMIGHLDPIDTLSGIKARLDNMGYLCGEGNDKLDDITRRAIRAFQIDNKLKLLADGATEIDKTTQNKIEEKYSE